MCRKMNFDLFVTLWAKGFTSEHGENIDEQKSEQ